MTRARPMRTELAPPAMAAGGCHAASAMEAPAAIHPNSPLLAKLLVNFWRN